MKQSIKQFLISNFKTNNRCACPYCGGDNKSDRFLLWPEEKQGRGAYWCRQCRKSGDTVQLLVDHCGYKFRDAFKAVGQEKPSNYKPAGYRPVVPVLDKEFQPRAYENPVETWRVRAGEFVEKSHQILLENEKVLKYLAGRGLDLQAVKTYKLGWCAGEKENNCLFRSRSSWGLPVIKDAKTSRDKMLWIPRGIVIPCFKGGNIYRIRIRRPKEDLHKKTDIKYYAIPGSGHEVMGHNPSRKTFVVVEAELDEMMLARQAGSIVGTVALGSAAIKPGADVYHILKNSLRILVALDYDKAGWKASEWWLDNFEQAKLWPVPEGKDPGDAFKAGVDIKEWIIEGLPPILMMDMDYGYQKPEGMSSMEELKMLLTKYPITIHAEKDHAKIIYESGFNNRAIRKRVKDLFWGDEEVHWYLRIFHPDTIIHGDNCVVNLDEIVIPE